MHSIKTSFILGLMMLPLMVAGQQTPDRLIITGQIIDFSTGAPLPAANVMITDLDIGNASDADGYYRIELPISGTAGEQINLSVHYIGYNAVALPVTVTPGTITLDFYLLPAPLSLKETVITAPRRSISSGSPSQIFSGDELRKTGSNNWEDALAGRIPGFQIGSGGNLGAVPVFDFRGRTSFRRPTEIDYPLIVVDGMPYSNQMNPDGSVSGPTLYIGLAEIESIEVVRGPGAVWRFGSRAKMGAIIITTKSSR